MNDSLSQQANDQYLAAALAWLRLRLERLAWREQGPAIAPAPRAGAWSQRARGQAVTASAPLVRITDEQVAQAANAMAAFEDADTLPALIVLANRLGLTRLERETLLLCVAMELDPDLGELCGRAQGDPERPYPTFTLALSLFNRPSWDLVSPHRALRRWRLVEIMQSGFQPLNTSPLRADERIVNYVKGLNDLDWRLVPLLTPVKALSNGESLPTASQAVLGVGGENLPPSEQAVVDDIVRRLEQIGGRPGLILVQLVGSDAVSKQLVAHSVAAAGGRDLYRIPAEWLPANGAELEALARLWQRETHLLQLALYLDAHDLERTTSGDGPASLLGRFLARSSGLVFLDTREPWNGLGGESMVVDVAKPTPAEQQAAWAATLGPDAGTTPARLAGQFDLNLPDIRSIARIARTMPDDGTPLSDRVWQASLSATRPRLDALAQRLEPKAGWKDIVLPDAEEKLLHQIADQVGHRSQVYDDWGFRRRMNRGLGISALFAGESGTGKTMAAEVIANDLALNLYRIDLSAVVSKYIGETEKNLRNLFDAAEGGGTILFFDEADALFGKRTDVKDSHDRYANIEVNYLLQRMEGYRGLAILATNMKSALDLAFMRRIRFVVKFPFPDNTLRREIWARSFPSETLLEKDNPATRVDFNRLARLSLTGGSIQNIAVNAAFLAARDGSPVVTMPHLVEAARTEFRKLEKPFNDAEFRVEALEKTRA